MARLLATDPEFRDAAPDPAVREALSRPDLPLIRIVEHVMHAYADRPAIRERRSALVTDPVSRRRARRLVPGFTTRTYGQVWARATAIAADWAGRGLRAGDRVATIGFTSADYATLDLAAVRLGVVSVPLQPTASVARLRAIVEETEPALLASSPAYLGTAAELTLSAESVRAVVVFDHHPEVDDEREAFEAAQAELTRAGRSIGTLEAAIEHGRTLPAPPLPEPAPGEDPLSCVVYTSGSTGTPKGALYPESLVRRWWTGALGAAGEPAIAVNFMPMSHMFGRATIVDTFGRGGINHFTARSDLSTLFEDLGMARPTSLMTVPRLFDTLFERYQAERDRRRGEFTVDAELDAAVTADIRRRFLGDRLLHAVVGSAPTSPEIRAFAEAVLGVPLHEVYGATEFGLVLVDGRIQRPPVLEYKLVDVPELGYSTSDRPHPRGELLVKTDPVFPGYYRRPEVTASAFDEDGFYRTGDIMAETGPDRLEYVDRRANVQKLSQGEFVTLSTVELTLAANPLIHQIFVYGSSSRPYLLAVIVPTGEALRAADGPASLKAELAAALQTTARQAGLEPYEVPRDFLIETEPFSIGNGLLSDIRKQLRPRLRERYGDQLDQLYEEIERGQDDELRALRANGADRPVYETVARAAQALLGCDSTDLGPETQFTDLGGDSLSALSFAHLLCEIFGVEVPVAVILSPASDLGAIARYVETERSSAGQRPTFGSVHGTGATEVRAADLRLEKFLDGRTLEAAKRLAPAAGEPKTVLLTGATGFLGRFVALDWLERFAERGGKLICLVRATDDTEARRRVEKVYDTGDTDLVRRFRYVAEDHLEVLAGDLQEARLGLPEPLWSRLAADVDAITHVGALVNHVLPYEQLFGPNVVGTAELIRLAVTAKLKPFTYLSTIGIADQIDASSFAEAPDIRRLSPVRHCGEGYADGYSTSKWAGEVLLREAHEMCGLPVAVFRSDMILAHRRYAGQVNVPDLFTRLLLSVLTTGLAPKSFYRTEDGAPPAAHYDGLPVDFTAEAVNTLGARGYDTYHVLNPHEDGISLDTFVDWLAAAGHRIERVDDYSEWLRRFRAALGKLPEDQQRHSVLPLLHSYEHPAEPARAGIAPSDGFQEAVRRNKIGVPGCIPHVTEELILKYATDLRVLGLG
ncbi:thioester reductase domain-containing protein [Amycolatopsis sp. FDAARGOS 1241]|nr:thioester reductase domain-containing protein [Amycolatopsis sp. FDAARGOS 1241]